MQALKISVTEQEMAGKLVAVSEVAAFVRRCMVAVGTPEEHAASLSDILVAADSRGHYSHGLNRLGKKPYATLPEYVLQCLCWRLKFCYENLNFTCIAHPSIHF